MHELSLLGLGERHFMESFIDGDLAANNGGWQWTASVSRLVGHTVNQLTALTDRH
jgi:hypothetical protein